MRELDECRAEVFRRSENRIKKQRSVKMKKKRLGMTALVSIVILTTIITVGYVYSQSECKDHAFETTTIITKATCFAEGVEQLTCSKCGQTKEAAIPKTEHDYYEDIYCLVCDRVNKYSEGLHFELLDDKSGYEVSMGNCKDRIVAIPGEYDGLPVKKITDYGFYGKTDIRRVIISEGVETIGKFAFDTCIYINYVSIPDSMKTIEKSVFDDRAPISTVRHDNALYFGNAKNPYAVLRYAQNKEIDNCSIHPDTKFIGEAAFEECKNLNGITIPDGVLGIGDYAFKRCEELEGIIIPDSVTDLGASAFSQCKSIKSVTFSKSLKEIKGYTFSGCAMIESVVIPEGITFIGYESFDRCSSLKSVVFPSTLKNIDDQAFWVCSALENVVFPKDIERIGVSAFQECSSLTNIVIPEGMTEVGNNAFSFCPNIVSVTIPASVTRIDGYSFKACTKLTDIYYGGTKDAFNSAVDVGKFWGYTLFQTIESTGTVHCSDGEIQY